MSSGQVMVWEQHRLRVSVLRGEEGTRRHEGSGQDAQARGVRRGRAGMRRGHERVHRHERSGEDAQAREVRRGRVGTRRGQERTRGHEEGSGEDARARGGVRRGCTGTRRGQERTRGHKEGSGEDVRARGGVRRGRAGTRRGQGGCQETQREEAAPCPVSGRPQPTFQTQSCGPALHLLGSMGVLTKQPLCLMPSGTGAVPSLPTVGAGADWAPTPPPGPGDLPGRSPWRTSCTGCLRP